METSDLLTALGYDHNMRDGEYIWKGEAPSPEIVALCELGDFLKEDLDKPAAVSVDVEKEKSVIAKMKFAQLAEINRLRMLALRREGDAMFFEAQAENKPLDEWRGLWAEIKVRYPYPGEYR
jgi:hypothetical protein